jgi:isoamylase
LHDLVSYNERHNEDNLEQNRDGHGHNLSDNNGVEGSTTDIQIKTLRDRQKRNMFVTLMVSQGIPHILGGDELSRSQKGNNNAYCQDNKINWLNWHLNERRQDFLAFCIYAIELRKQSELLNCLNLKDDNYTLGHNVDKINWYRPDGERKVIDDWQDHNNQAFAVEFKGVADEKSANIPEHWLLVTNATDHDVRFNLPTLDNARGWKIMLDTRYEKLALQPQVVVNQVYMQAYKSICLFKAIT